MSKYWYNSSCQTSTGTTLFRVVYGRDPLGLLLYTETVDDPPLVSQWLTHRDKILSQLKSNLLRAQIQMKRNADKKRSMVTFKEGDWVFVKLQPYRQHSVVLRRNQKLGMKYFGPFQIAQKIGNVIYRLHLPAGTKIHSVFHVSLLKPCLGDPSFTTIPLPMMSLSQGPLIFPVVILQSRQIVRHGQQVKRVLIQWHDLAPEETSWEDVDQLAVQYPHLDLEDMVLDYERGHCYIASQTG